MAIELEPSDVDTIARAYLNRSFFLRELCRTDEAAADLRAVLGLIPPTHELNLRATAALAALGFGD